MKTAFRIIGILFIIVALGFAGRADYNEVVIQTLSYKQYWAIVEDLGGNASDTQIVELYMKNRAHYDSIK